MSVIEHGPDDVVSAAAGGIAADIGGLLRGMARRGRDRRERKLIYRRTAHLDAHLLRDIGLSVRDRDALISRR
ncbi:hypothetical protein [Pseudoruegeria sp. HB172150]|uniref:hypothetical protein n=1 Tax=Pseudoruegeria sp. HB172150 TaxID=2721164 RepID=UPI001556CE16|nr:hypothetical protein [Pseudoruegeria sp. HB172150]